MKKLNLMMLTVATLVLIGCGGSSNTSDDTLKTETNMKERFNYFKDGIFSKDGNTTICHKGLYGDSYKIHIYVYDSAIRFYTYQHRRNDCSDEPIDYAYSSYIYEIGDESADKKSVNIFLTNDSYNYGSKYLEIESMVSKLIFGQIVYTTYYTSVIGSGDIRTEKLKIAFAHATTENDGSSPEKRANNISNYTEGKFYFLEN